MKLNMEFAIPQVLSVLSFFRVFLIKANLQGIELLIDVHDGFGFEEFPWFLKVFIIYLHMFNSMYSN